MICARPAIVGLLTLVAVLAVVVTSWSRPVYAATFTVTKTADTADGTCDADCSLREAIGTANARPGAVLSLEGEVRPDRITTVFAGMDREAVARARELMAGYPPSSPAIALFKDGKVVHMLERHQIEGRNAIDIARDLTSAFQEHCTS